MTCTLCGGDIATGSPHAAWDWWPDSGPGPIRCTAHLGCARLQRLIDIDHWNVGDLAEKVGEWVDGDAERLKEAQAEAAGCEAAEAVMAWVTA